MKNKKAFTLAEIMIVLVILGIVAAITIPAVVNRHMEAERRTKLKKAMTVYDTALNKMVIENGIKSDTALTNWADSNTKNDCANTSAYFKVSRNLEVNGNSSNCKFRAADGVFWDISDIKKPLVALREQDLNDATAQSDTNRAFYMFGWFDEQGSLRSNDMGKISATDKADLEKLYDFIAGKTKTSLKEVAVSTPFVFTPSEFSNDYSKECDSNLNCDVGECKGCTKIVGDRYFDDGHNSYEHDKIVYNSNGHVLSKAYGCWESGDMAGICDNVKLYAKDSSGNDLVTLNDCYSTQNGCDSCTNINNGTYCQEFGYIYCDGGTCTMEEDDME